MSQNIKLWVPSDRREKRRLVEVLAIYYQGNVIEGALIREVDKPLQGVGIVPLHELREWRER